MRYGHQREFDDGLHALHSGIIRGTDGSLAARDEDLFHDECSPNGIEIRTPVLSLDEGRDLFERILDFLKAETARNFKTNETCGLHVNLSEVTMSATEAKHRLWYAHLARGFPEHTTLAKFNREDNEFCYPLFARGPVSQRPSAEEIVESIEQSFGSYGEHGKYHTVGFHGEDCRVNSPSNARRVEFRCLGNTNYHKKRKLLNETVDTIVKHATRAYENVAGKISVSGVRLPTSALRRAA